MATKCTTVATYAQETKDNIIEEATKTADAEYKTEHHGGEPGRDQVWPRHDRLRTPPPPAVAGGESSQLLEQV